MCRCQALAPACGRLDTRVPGTYDTTVSATRDSAPPGMNRARLMLKKAAQVSMRCIARSATTIEGRVGFGQQHSNSSAAHPSRRHQTMGLVAAKGYTGSSQDFQFSPPVFTSATTGCVRAACQECLNHEVLSSPDCELSSPDCELAMALMQSPSCQQQQQLREWVPSPHGRSRI